MGWPNKWLRIVLIVLFVLLTLPSLPLLGFNVSVLSGLVLVDLCVRAMPLYLAWIFDRAFYDGGELSPQLIPLWVGLTALMLWPLLVLGVRPTLWRSRAWRGSIIGYASAAFVGTVAASSWVFTHLGVFF